ncbi:MAG: hypothetical protein RIE73_20460 [Coleofasciculus sp. C1-SOL-03]
MYSIHSGRPPLARRSENCGIDITIESVARRCAPTVEQVVGWVDAPKPNKNDSANALELCSKKSI